METLRTLARRGAASVLLVGLGVLGAHASIAQTVAADANAAATAAKPVTFAADVFFDVDKAELKPAAKRKLTVLAAQMKGLNLESVTIIGHTDSDASNEHNDKLSSNRSRAVRDHLVSQGVSLERIKLTGRGKAQPVSDNGTRAGKSLNRRVEIEVVGTYKGSKP